MGNFFVVRWRLRAAVLGRMGGLSPSKSVCSILPIARYYGPGCPYYATFPGPTTFAGRGFDLSARAICVILNLCNTPRLTG